MALGILLIAIGALYLVKPTLFRRGIWLRTSIAIRTLSEENYIRYMRVLGVLLSWPVWSSSSGPFNGNDP